MLYWCNCSYFWKWQLIKNNPDNIYMFKVNNRNNRKSGEICLKLTIKTPEWRHWHRFCVFIINLEHILHLSSRVFTAYFKQVNITCVTFFPSDIDVNDILNYQKNYLLHQWRRSGVFILNFEHVLHLFLLFLLSSLNK